MAREDFTPGSFDLIHARSVLANLPERDTVLARMANWLAPGGWLVIEDPAGFPVGSSPYPAYRRLMRAFEEAMRLSHGADLRWPRLLPARLAKAGLECIGMRMFPQYVGDGGPGEDIWRLALAQARPFILDGRLLTAEEFAEGIASFDDPAFVDLSIAMISAWGRTPLGDRGPDRRDGIMLQYF